MIPAQLGRRWWCFCLLVWRCAALRIGTLIHNTFLWLLPILLGGSLLDLPPESSLLCGTTAEQHRRKPFASLHGVRLGTGAQKHPILRHPPSALSLAKLRFQLPSAKGILSKAIEAM